MNTVLTTGRKSTEMRSKRVSPRLTPAARDGWRLGIDTEPRREAAETRRLILLMESMV